MDTDQIVRLVQRYPNQTCESLANQAGTTVKALLPLLRECATAGLVVPKTDHKDRMRWSLV